MLRTSMVPNNASMIHHVALVLAASGIQAQGAIFGSAGCPAAPAGRQTQREMVACEMFPRVSKTWASADAKRAEGWMAVYAGWLWFVAQKTD